jgi:hypothetical protein
MQIKSSTFTDTICIHLLKLGNTMPNYSKNENKLPSFKFSDSELLFKVLVNAEILNDISSACDLREASRDTFLAHVSFLLHSAGIL